MDKDKNIKTAKIAPLPPKLSYEPLMKKLTAAHEAVGELRGLLSALPNPKILIAPFRKREAVASSAIEGTRATLDEVLKFEAIEEKPNPEEKHKERRKIDDILEVRNYEMAMRVALEELKKRPIGENLLKSAHKVLLSSVRGSNKSIGNFRKEQVSVGDYIPPVHTEISALIDNWEKYINGSLEEDVLIRIGIAHYQFEAIHPFLDGNGRIGRLIVPLFLCQEGTLKEPVLYISHYLEAHKVEYQRLLHKVDTDKDWIAWLSFFLTAIEVHARETAKLAEEIQNLYERLKNEVVIEIRSKYSMAVLDIIFSHPIVSARTIIRAIDAKSKGTTYSLIEKFVEAGVLREMSMPGREKLYIFPELLKLIRA